MWIIPFLVFIVACCQAKLSVKSPKFARKKFGEYGAKIEIPEVGLIPYGSKFTGQLVYVESNSDGCEAFERSLSSRSTPNPIVLVKEG